MRGAGFGKSPGDRRLVFRIVLLTCVFEIVTLVLRFGLGLQSTRDTAGTIGLLTGGVRIHHGYIGVLLLIPAIWFRRIRSGPAASWWVAVAMALILSDLVHHFLVLWPITGSPQFDLVYPEQL